MTNVTVRCDACRAEIGHTDGDDFHPKYVTERGHSTAPPVPLATMAGWTGDATVYFACGGRDHHNVEACTIAERVAFARRRGDSDVTIPVAKPRT